MRRYQSRYQESTSSANAVKQPLIRDLVLIALTTDRDEHLTLQLTRVPCIGEELFHDADTFKVTRVSHATVDDDGRAYAGFHAYVEGIWQPDDPPKPKKRRKKPMTT